MSQITTHILDTAAGSPAAGVTVALAFQDGEKWQAVATGVTNSDGRVADLCDAGSELAAGIYRLRFATGEYFQRRGEPVFYPRVDVVFQLAAGGSHYHVPLLLAPFGYSTYRGS